MSLSTKHRGGGQYTSPAVTFVGSQGPDIHLSLAGTSQHNVEKDRYLAVDVHKSLEEVLRRTLLTKLELELPENAAKLEELSERLAGAEDQYKERKNGRWHSIWYSIGEGKDMIDPWVALIPNEYGLAVVKTGLAVVFKLAERSSARREKIFNAFAGIRDALARADPERRSFLSNKEVGQQADHLTKTIVECIEDMILLTMKKDKSWRPKFTRHHKKEDRAPPPDADAILEKLANSTKEFEEAVDLARDNAIEATGFMTQFMAQSLPVIHDDVLIADSRIQHMDRKQDIRDQDYRRGYEEMHSMLSEVVRYTRRLAEREQNLRACQIEARTDLVHVLRESKKQQMEIKRLRRQQLRAHKPTAIVGEAQLFQILSLGAQPEDYELSDLSNILQEPNRDLEATLTYKGKLRQDSQRQVQAALLIQDRFLQWLENSASDLIMVDANIRNPGMSKTSVISVFSATFITSMITARPEDVVVHYFCGRHSRPQDPWYGPNGLVRLITMQLLMKLMELSRPNLDFLNQWDQVKDLEEHNLDALCELLYCLVEQFPEDVTVCLVIDSISRLDTPRTFGDLRIVMECLHSLVDNATLYPTVKVLLTNPMHSKRTMKQLDIFQEDPSRLVWLNPNNALKSPTNMSERVIGKRLFGS
ncbi:hypothetical protein P170DRAFT_435110 [Aspergillus steynii IBT 23096]|uniref:Uncharacterized protein n=1 Tax=Aspergillus steynii IBT 23096 TaxID=1392250 RepID=A0A2I2GKS7_9EURO|nr:uncharacterized protein P170DRAFT_435110 [Aspergillus steynii IBT 23096]PLB53482.1 hypothetical protein P170DRAFT_435110 [Aspergillus steynii IBT 23096]